MSSGAAVLAKQKQQEGIKHQTKLQGKAGWFQSKGLCVILPVFAQQRAQRVCACVCVRAGGKQCHCASRTISETSEAPESGTIPSQMFYTTTSFRTAQSQHKVVCVTSRGASEQQINLPIGYSTHSSKMGNFDMHNKPNRKYTKNGHGKV